MFVFQRCWRCLLLSTLGGPLLMYVYHFISGCESFLCDLLHRVHSLHGGPQQHVLVLRPRHQGHGPVTGVCWTRSQCWGGVRHVSDRQRTHYVTLKKRCRHFYEIPIHCCSRSCQNGQLGNGHPRYTSQMNNKLTVRKGNLLCLDRLRMVVPKSWY